MATNLQHTYERLFDAYGPQGWWPGESPFEIIVGTILTQNTNWQNVEKTIARLREADLLTPCRLFDVDVEELAELIRPAGYFRLKAGRLRNFLRYLAESHHGSLEAMFAIGLDSLREDLLAINGIGPETADSILLYAGGFPTFVVDTYTARVLNRHGWIEPEADYHAIKDEFESQLESNVEMFNEFHALIVQVGKRHCGPKPMCAGCPLECMLPEGGIVQWQ